MNKGNWILIKTANGFEYKELPVYSEAAIKRIRNIKGIKEGK